MRKIFILGFVIFIILVLAGAGWFYFSAGSKSKSESASKIASQNQKIEKQSAGSATCENQYQNVALKD